MKDMFVTHHNAQYFRMRVITAIILSRLPKSSLPSLFAVFVFFFQSTVSHLFSDNKLNSVCSLGPFGPCISKIRWIYAQSKGVHQM